MALWFMGIALGLALGILLAEYTWRRGNKPRPIKQSVCLQPGCGHRRTLHSWEGCHEENCGCAVKYMDRERFA